MRQMVQALAIKSCKQVGLHVTAMNSHTALRETVTVIIRSFQTRTAIKYSSQFHQESYAVKFSVTDTERIPQNKIFNGV